MQTVCFLCCGANSVKNQTSAVGCSCACFTSTEPPHLDCEKLIWHVFGQLYRYVDMIGPNAVLTRNVLSSFFCGTPSPGFEKLGLPTPLQPLKIPRLRVKVRHRLLNLCDCGSVLSEHADKIFKQ